jgi:hypothetical protein
MQCQLATVRLNTLQTASESEKRHDVVLRVCTKLLERPLQHVKAKSELKQGHVNLHKLKRLSTMTTFDSSSHH